MSDKNIIVVNTFLVSNKNQLPFFLQRPFLRGGRKLGVCMYFHRRFPHFLFNSMAISDGSCYIDIIFIWMSDSSKCGVVFFKGIAFCCVNLLENIFFISSTCLIWWLHIWNWKKKYRILKQINPIALFFLDNDVHTS